MIHVKTMGDYEVFKDDTGYFKKGPISGVTRIFLVNSDDDAIAHVQRTLDRGFEYLPSFTYFKPYFIDGQLNVGEYKTVHGEIKSNEYPTWMKGKFLTESEAYDYAIKMKPLADKKIQQIKQELLSLYENLNFYITGPDSPVICFYVEDIHFKYDLVNSFFD